VRADWPYGGPGRDFGGRPVSAASPYGGASRQATSPWVGAPPASLPGASANPQPRRKRRLLVGSGFGLALAAVAVVAWPHPGTSPVGHQTPAAGASASASSSSGVVRGIDNASVMALFARRSAALRSGSLAGWLADVDPAKKALVAQQKQQFAGLRALPLVSYGVQAGTSAQHDQYVPADDQVGATSTRSLGLQMVYQLRGFDPGPVAREYVPILAEHDGHLMIEGDQTQNIDPGTPLEPWESGPIAVAVGKRALVVVSARDRSRLPALVAQADAAVGWVGSMWPKTGSVRPVLYALRDRAVIARYAVHQSTVADFDGVTVGAYDPAADPVVRGTRVLFNPKFVTPTSSVALLNDLLRHEFTHVAHWNDTHLGTPTWAIEGIAEYTSFRGHRSDQRISGEIGKAARAGRLPKTLPRTRDFYVDPRGIHYGMGWLTFEYLSETYGEAKLRKLYYALAAITYEPDSKGALRAESTAFVKVLGVGETTYVTHLNTWIGHVLRPV